jgi:shikimate dehydrogenase
MTPPDSPKRFAVIGNPAAHSRSPFIHEQFARQTDIRLAYGIIEAPTSEFNTVVRDFFHAQGVGLNVTVPFKEQAWQLAQDGLTPRARAAGAVNTLWMQEGHLHGCNTDGVGLVNDLLRLGQTLHGRNILLIGAGGAARGVVLPLLTHECARLHIVNRTADRAADLCEHMRAQMPPAGSRLSWGGLDETAGRWDMVINATASSLSGAAPQVPPAAYAHATLAYDMMYGSRPTPFMRAATQYGAHHVADGLGMLVGQAAASFALWHGVTPAVEPVLAALRALLAEPAQDSDDAPAHGQASQGS